MVASGVQPEDLSPVGVDLDTAFLALQATDLETEFLRANDIFEK